MLGSEELRDIYRRLWTLIHPGKEPVPVSYRFQTFMPRGSSAYFFLEPRPGLRRPGIWVGRVHELLPAPDARCEPDLEDATLEELIALAHERGHERSEHEGTYVENNMREEHRAWGHAKEILEPMGFTEWEAFERHKADSLAEHVRRGTPE